MMTWPAMPDSASFLFSPTGVGVSSLRRDPAPKAADPPPLPPSTEHAERSEAVVFSTAAINPAYQLPPNIAVLKVDRSGTDMFLVQGFSSVIPLPKKKKKLRYKRPSLALGDLARKGSPKTPSQIVGKLRLWSEAKPEIVDWLIKVREDLRRALDEELYLVIADGTGFDIPWEMLDLSPATTIPRYLGALVPVVRWHPCLDKIEKGLYAEANPGGMLAYVDKGLAGSGAELKLLRNLDLRLSDDLVDFLRLLGVEESGVGLVYLACHGIFVHDDVNGVWFESSLDKEHRLVLGKLYWESLSLLQSSKSVVFLNVCDSARPVLDEAINDDRLRGFVNLFLSKGASGVIGTVGMIGEKFASDTTQELVNASLETPGCSIAVLLRNMRSTAIKGFSDKINDESAQLRVVYAFMYVYYGSPMTHLPIARRQAGS